MTNNANKNNFVYSLLEKKVVVKLIIKEEKFDSCDIEKNERKMLNRRYINLLILEINNKKGREKIVE